MGAETHLALLDQDVDELNRDIQEVHALMKEIQDDVKAVRTVMIGVLCSVTAAAVLFAINVAVHAFS